MTLSVYNSLKRKKEPFVPQKPGEVTMYVCGPTVYSLSHIGHARSAVAFDVIYKYLKSTGLKVSYARNYTDVDDKIINRASDEGKSSEVLAEENIIAFDEDMDALGVAVPDFRPKATETMGEIVALIETLIEKGFAYALGNGDVYYSVRRFEGYGKLSGKNIEDLEHGARVDVDTRKEDPLDFALWKAAKPGEPAWESPWGGGRPGWHIECSAMSQTYLGETIDIHGGGKDLIFPHHENEIAQSEASTGKPFVRYWLHNGFVNIEKEKMSKSIGNILNIREALKEHSSEAIRLFLLSSHYRSPIDYSAHNLKEAESALERFYKTLERMETAYPQVKDTEPDAGDVSCRMAPVKEAMDDDFNTAEAIGSLFKEITEANRLMDKAARQSANADIALLVNKLSAIRSVIRQSASFLGVFSREADDYFEERKGGATMPPAEIEALIAERKQARADKDFARADEIRDDLKARGIILEDSPKGTTWSVG